MITNHIYPMCRGKCTIPRGIRQHVWLDWVISFLLLINFIEYLKVYTAGGWAKGVKHTHYTNVDYMTTRPPRQIALSDKLPSWTNRPPTHPLFSTKWRRGRFVFSSDKSPSYVGKTNRPPVSNRKREGDLSSARTNRPPM